MRVRVNGVDLYYQKLGHGQPLLLVHGHHFDSSMFDRVIVPLAASYTVYAMDFRGHGISGGEPAEHYQTEVSDLAAFIRALHIQQPDCFAFGAGGLVALTLAYQYPNILHKLIVAGTFVNGAGIRPVHYLTEGIHRFVQGNRDSRVELTENYLSAEALRQIKVPCLCVVGEKDWVKIEHVRWYSQLMPNARLVIMPRQKHSSYVDHSLKTLDLIKDFFKDKGAVQW
jgi:pimeloyl-ACP methyl ester carboxylesterase